MLKCCALFLVFLPYTCPAKILGIFPIFSRSHFAVFEPLLLQLVSRGHSVTVVSAYPLAEPAREYVHIDVQEAREKFNGSWSLDTFPEIPVSFRDVLFIMSEQIKDHDSILRLKKIQDLIKSRTAYDLLIIEQFTSDVFLGFAHVFKAPFITFSSCPPMPWASRRYGVPGNLASSPNLLSGGLTSKMDFYQRGINTLQVIYARLYQRFVLNTISEVMSKKYFGDDTPSLEEIAKHSSLFLVNSHPTFYSAQSVPPQVLEVGGIHVRTPKPLLQDLDQWMNESIEGVVYFSFGSMLRGATLPADKVNVFLQVFKSLKQRVLWKWEDEAVDGLPSNVKVMKWLPQRDVLAHPKVKVFISHGGLLGTTEAVVSGVPILGIPMYGDQPNNVAALVEKGVGIHVDYNNISVASLSYALNTLINDKSYSENVRELSRRFLDRPMSPLDTAVYWTEYVIRHRGAPHLQSYAVHLPWYQYYLLDVISVCLAALMIVLVVFYYVIRSFLRVVCSFKTTKLKTN